MPWSQTSPMDQRTQFIAAQDGLQVDRSLPAARARWAGGTFEKAA